MAETVVVILNLFSFALILILVALGLVVVFGMMRVINMAHGELFMLGAYAVVALQAGGISYWVAVLVTPFIVACIGLVIEGLLIRHIYQRTLDTILATWGLSIVLKQGVVLVFGPGSYSVIAPMESVITMGDITYPLFRLIVMALALIIIGVTFWLFLKTDFGLAARAVMARPNTASSLGINTRFYYRVSFILGTALAGLAGALVAPLISVDPQMGLGYLIPAFISIMVGGSGVLSGVLVGGTIISGTGNLLTIWVSPVIAQIAVFSLAIVLIRFRPNGLMGGRDGT